MTKKTKAIDRQRWATSDQTAASKQSQASRWAEAEVLLGGKEEPLPAEVLGAEQLAQEGGRDGGARHVHRHPAAPAPACVGVQHALHPPEPAGKGQGSQGWGQAPKARSPPDFLGIRWLTCCHMSDLFRLMLLISNAAVPSIEVHVEPGNPLISEAVPLYGDHFGFHQYSLIAKGVVSLSALIPDAGLNAPPTTNNGGKMGSQLELMCPHSFLGLKS